MSIREMTADVSRASADVSRVTAELSSELAAARRAGYVETEIVLSLPKYGWLKHPLRWMIHRLFDGATVQIQITVPTTLWRTAAEREETGT